MDEFLAETAEKGFDNSVWQRICANFRLLLRRLGLDIAYSDDELRELFRRSRNALKMQQQLTATNGKSGARFALDRKPANIDDFRRLPAHNRPNKIKFDNIKELYEIYKNEYLGKTFTTSSGHNITFKPGHFFRLIAGTPNDGKKGFIAKANNAEHAIELIENGEITQEDIAGFEYSRAENLLLFKDVIMDSDFWFEELKNRVVFGKKYNDLTNADGFVGVTLEIENNNLGILSFHPRKFSDKFFENKEINWNIINPVDHMNAPEDVSSTDKSLKLADNIADKNDLSSAENEKNQENLRFSLKNGENAPVLTVDWQKEGMPKLEDFETETIDADSPSLYEELEEKLKKALADTLNAEDYNGQRFDDIYDEEWQEMSEDERIKNIEESYDYWQNDIYSEVADNNKYAREAAEKQHSEAVTQWGKEQLLIPARDMARAYAESLGYTIIEEDENSSGTSYYLKVNNGKGDMTLRFSDHAQPYYKWNGDEVTYMRNGKQYTAHTDIEVLIKDFKLDLAPIWKFLEEFAPQGNEGTDNGVRYSINDELADYPIDQRKLNWYKNIIGKKIRLQYNDPNELAQYLIENGVQYDHERDYRTLNAAIQQTKQEVRERSTRIRNSRENAVMAKKDKFYKILSQKYGKDFKINAGTKYDGVEFIGDWMDKHKTEKGRAKAIKAEEAAEVLSKALGEDISADLVVEHFRSLKKSGLLAEYREIRRNKRLLAELAEELAEEDRMELTKDEFLGTKNVDETPEMKEYRKKYLKEQAKYRKADMDKFIQENMPELYTWVLEFLPVGGKIKPTMTFAGEEFTGDWIPREWKTYSRSKPGKKTGLKLLQYERKREGALKHSSGMNSDEIAQAIASKYGGDAAAIEQQIIDLFRDLKQSDLRKMYVDSKIEEKNQLKSEIEEYNAMNAAESFRLLLEQAQMERVSLIRIQDLAKKYVQKYIPKEMQGTFIQDIVQLNKYSDKPSPAYPDGRREFELAKLLKKIHSFNAKTRIMELLDGTRKRLNSTGIPISNFGDNSNAIAKIRDIVKLQPMDVERAIIDLNERIAQAEIDIENGIENAPDPNQLRTEKSLYEMFGKLDLKTPEELGYALKELRYLIDQNKESLYFRLKNKLEGNRKRNFQVMQEVDGSMSPFIPKKPKDPDKKLSDFLAKNAGLKNLLHLITGKSNKAFEDTELGKLFDELESATWRGASLDRSAMENASKKLYEFFGIKTLKQKKNFFEKINETPEHTGIFINRYTSEMTSHFDPETGENIMLQTDKRGFVKGVISVAHARKVVAEYDQDNASQENSLEIQQAFPKYSSDQAKEILKNITGKNLKNNETGISAQINTKQYNKMISNAAVDKSLANGYSRDNHFEAVANIEELFQNAVLLEKTGDLKNNDSNVNIYRFASPFIIDNEIADVLITVKESIDKDSKRIYSLELTEIKKLSAKGNSGNTVYYTDSINKLHQKHEKIKSFLEKNQKKSDLGIEFLRQQLNDFDLGMDKVYDLFGNADENEAWKLIIEKTGTKSKEEQNYKSLYPNQYRPKEQTNSLPPRQILDTI